MYLATSSSVQVLSGMKINNSSVYGIVGDLIAVINQDEELDKPAHNGGGYVDVLLDTLAPVIATR